MANKLKLLKRSDSHPDPVVPKKLKTPIKAKYDEAAIIPTLLSAQKGIKCWVTSPFEVSPQMKNVIAKIQNPGWDRAPLNLFKLLVIFC